MNKGSLKIIHKNKFGLIGICKCCGDFHVQIGNAVLALNEVEYIDFEDIIKEVISYTKSSKINPKEKLMVRVDEHRLILSFTKKEIEQTIELFEMSRLLFSANQLIA